MRLRSAETCGFLSLSFVISSCSDLIPIQTTFQCFVDIKNIKAIMAEAIAIFGVVAGAIGAINTTLQWIERFKKTVREFQNVGETFHELWSDFIVLQIRFNEWSKLYKVNKSQATEFFAVIWGRVGAESIVLQLIAIYRVMERFNDILALFISTEVLNILNPGIQHEFRGLQIRPVSLDKRISQSSEISKKIKKSMTTKEKSEFLLCGNNGLKSGLEEFRERMNLLRDDAKAFDIRRSKQQFPEDDAVAMIEFEEEETPEILRLALDTKIASNALYSSCIAPAQGSFGLVATQNITKYVKFEMQLRDGSLLERGNIGNRQALHFHLLIARPDIVESPFEILVEGPISLSEDSSQLSRDSGGSGFLEACEAVLNDGESRFCVIFNSQALWFHSRLPPNLIQVEQRPSIPLSEIFSASRSQTSSPFLLGDKVSLAYQIVECGLLLLGTSWFSNLRSRYVQRTRDSKRQYRFVLETPLESPGQSRDQEARTILGRQIFWIGVILTEIAIGQPVLDANTDETGRLRLKTASFLHPVVLRWYSVADVLGQVHGMATKRYKNAVEFCLRKRQGSLHWRARRTAANVVDDDHAFEIITREYYTEVFLS
jgi:hypothetical protein